MPAPNTLYYGDNLDVLRRYVVDESVDLVYLDPPFKSDATYNVLYKEADETKAAAQIHAFDDTWTWDTAAQKSFQETIEAGGDAAKAMQALNTLLGPSGMLAYLAMMAPRLAELHRVLKQTGSIFLHCDPSASHYLKLLMDAIFGPGHFRNEIAWCYYGPGSPGVRQFLRKHDTIFWYSKSGTWTFNRDAVRVPHADKTKQNFKEGLVGSGFVGDETLGDAESLNVAGKVLEDWWIIPIAARSTKEYLGYPTQKPRRVLQRIIAAASNEGETVLDPFCGCGTAVEVAHELKRNWIGIDVTHLAIGLIKHRLDNRFGESAPKYDVIGEPADLQSAEQLAKENRFQFQAWALGLVDARTHDSSKKGPDKGVDGRLFFMDEGDVKSIVFSVKSGKLKADDVRALISVVERENAAMGALVTLKPPTKGMRSDAAAAGFYDSPAWGKFQKIQILEIENLLDGSQRLEAPPRGANVTVKKADKATGPAQGTQMGLAADAQSEGG